MSRITRGYVTYDDIINELNDRDKMHNADAPLELMESFEAALEHTNKYPHTTILHLGQSWYIIGITELYRSTSAHTMAQNSLRESLLSSGMNKTNTAKYIKEWNKRNREAGARHKWYYEPR